MFGIPAITKYKIRVSFERVIRVRQDTSVIRFAPLRHRPCGYLFSRNHGTARRCNRVVDALVRAKRTCFGAVMVVQLMGLMRCHRSLLIMSAESQVGSGPRAATGKKRQGGISLPDAQLLRVIRVWLNAPLDRIG